MALPFKEDRINVKIRAQSAVFAHMKRELSINPSIESLTSILEGCVSVAEVAASLFDSGFR